MNKLKALDGFVHIRMKNSRFQIPKCQAPIAVYVEDIYLWWNGKVRMVTSFIDNAFVVPLAAVRSGWALLRQEWGSTRKVIRLQLNVIFLHVLLLTSVYFNIHLVVSFHSVRKRKVD